MKEKNIIILYSSMGLLISIYGIEQLLGYLLFKIPVNISWWIGFISILFGICLICRGIDLYKRKLKKLNKF
ncbi:MAG: hypothetical protein LN408_00130 [Candidatus Thermoplasmatota archaeon]|nr:hypothetical protein [Candidatus Thermoplasmatota archaeon]